MAPTASETRQPVRRTYGKRSRNTPASSADDASTINPYGLGTRPVDLAPASQCPDSGHADDTQLLNDLDEKDIDKMRETDQQGVLQEMIGGSNTIMDEHAKAKETDSVDMLRTSSGSQAKSFATGDSSSGSAPGQRKQISLNSFFSRQAVGSSQARARTATPFDSQRATDSTCTQSTLASMTQLHLLPVRLHASPSSQSTALTSRYTTCSICLMTYLPSGLGGEDEKIHAKHCERVQEGERWEVLDDRVAALGGGRDGAGRDPGRIVLRDVRVGRGGSGGRSWNEVMGDVICVAGKVAVGRNNKLLGILSSVDTVLSAPSLSDSMLDQCQIFFFVSSCPPPAGSTPIATRKTSTTPNMTTDPIAQPKPAKRLKPEEFRLLAEVARARERGQKTAGATIPGGRGKGRGRGSRVVGVLVTQPIKWAMRVLSEEEKQATGIPGDAGTGDKRDLSHSFCALVDRAEKENEDEARALVRSPVETGHKRKWTGGDLVVACEGEARESGEIGAVICDPERLPTKLGVHRIFTVPAYRGLGISKILLDAACRHTISGYKCDPMRGEIAFSQPTSSGRAVMEAWGKGHVRVFVEDEQE